MFPLATIARHGPSVVRVACRDGRWAACVVLPRGLFVPCGDPDVIDAAGLPGRRWRLIVGDAAAADALLNRGLVSRWPVGRASSRRLWRALSRNSSPVVHVQRFQTVDGDRVPGPDEVADPGLRVAEPADVPGLTSLAVQLHRDDGYGPDPGRSGRQAYLDRTERAVERGAVWCVGEVGRPIVKIERAVDSPRYGVQLSGICVAPPARGRRLGVAAVTTAVRHAVDDYPGRPVSLHVRDDNAVALATYARAGFVDREEWRLAVNG